MTEPDAGGNLPAGALVRSARRLAEARWFLLALAAFIAVMVLATELTPAAGAVVIAGVIALSALLPKAPAGRDAPPERRREFADRVMQPATVETPVTSEELAFAVLLAWMRG